MPYPTCTRTLSATIPHETQFWPPVPHALLVRIDEYDPEDWDQDDPVELLVPPLGYFHDTRALGTVSHSSVVETWISEKELCDAIASVADGYDEFDRVAGAVIAQDFDDPELSPAQLEVVEKFDPMSMDFDTEFDVGVAALALAINLIGMHTRASCRGHRDDWSDAPVVYFAATTPGTQQLTPLLERAGGGYAWNPDHPDLLAIELPSIEAGWV